MNDKPETVTLYVTEVVQSCVTIEVTPEMLDEAAADGYGRTASGVARMFSDNPGHDGVADGAADPENFVAVIERDVTDWEVG